MAGSIPDYWIWAYYISPFAWGLRSLVINEFISPRWDAPALSMPGRTLGEEALLSFDFFTERKWIWAGVGYNVAATLLMMAASSVALQYLSGASCWRYGPCVVLRCAVLC